MDETNKSNVDPEQALNITEDNKGKEDGSNESEQQSEPRPGRKKMIVIISLLLLAVVAAIVTLVVVVVSNDSDGLKGKQGLQSRMIRRSCEL